MAIEAAEEAKAEADRLAERLRKATPEVLAAFKGFDRDQSNSIDVEELQKALESAGMKAPDAAAVLSKYDYNYNGARRRNHDYNPHCARIHSTARQEAYAPQTRLLLAPVQACSIWMSSCSSSRICAR